MSIIPADWAIAVPVISFGAAVVLCGLHYLFKWWYGNNEIRHKPPEPLIFRPGKYIGDRLKKVEDRTEYLEIEVGVYDELYPEYARDDTESIKSRLNRIELILGIDRRGGSHAKETKTTKTEIKVKTAKTKKAGKKSG